MIEDMKATQQELENLRSAFIDTKDENQKNETGKKIRSLESRIRTLKPEIKKLSIEMRNEEIKSFP